MKLLAYQELASKSFKEKLYNDPNTVLDIDKSVEVVIKENTKQRMYFVLSNPNAMLNESSLGLINAAGSNIVAPISTASTINTIAPTNGTTSTALILE